MSAVPVTYMFKPLQIGSLIIDNNKQDIVDLIKSGEYIFAPSFRFKDGKVELIEVSLIPLYMATTAKVITE